MSGGPTMQMPGPYAYQPGPPPRRAGRRALIIVLGVLAVIVLLIGADRIAAAYAANRIADQIKSHGFPQKPDVTVEGFPFLTQVVAHRLDGIDLSASGIEEGPIRVSLQANATGIDLNSGYNGGIITNVTGTGLIAFSSIASAASAEGAPGVKVSRAGPHSVKLTINLQIVDATAIASVRQTGPETFKIHITSANGVPSSLISQIGDFTVHIPTLPLGLSLHGLDVTSQGVVIHASGHHISFGQ